MRNFFTLICLFFLIACNRPTPPAQKQGEPVSVTVDTLEQTYTLEQSNELSLSLVSVELRPEDSINSKIQAHFNQEILNLAGSGDFTFKSKEQLADSLKAEFSQVYKDDQTTAQNWGLSQHLKVVLNDSLRLGLHLEQESYFGGAHPNRYSLFIYYSLTTGNSLDLADFIPLGTIDGLQKLATQALRKDYEIAADRSLEKAGFWLKDNVLPLPENFRLEEDSLHLVYNPYEIAPYAMGTIVITLSLADLVKLSPPAESNS